MHYSTLNSESHSRKSFSTASLSKFITLNMLIILTNINELSGLKCVCNPDDCDLIRQNDCPGKGLTVWDPCKYVQECWRAQKKL